MAPAIFDDVVVGQEVPRKGSAASSSPLDLRSRSPVVVSVIVERARRAYDRHGHAPNRFQHYARIGRWSRRLLRNARLSDPSGHPARLAANPEPFSADVRGAANNSAADPQ